MMISVGSVYGQEGGIGVIPYAKVFKLGSITVDAPAMILFTWEHPLTEPIKKNIVSSAEYYEDESDFYYSIRVNDYDVLCDVNLDLNWGNGTSIQYLNVTVIGADLTQTNSSATKENAIISFILRTNPKEIIYEPPKTNPPPPFTIPPPPTDEEKFADAVITIAGSLIGVGIVGVFVYYFRKIIISEVKVSKRNK